MNTPKKRPDRRKSSAEVSPAYEDSGLFKTPITHLLVDLVPMIGRTSRNDYVVKGFLDDRAVEVVFAGRRKSQAGPLLRTLQEMWSQALERHAHAEDPPRPDAVRLPVRIEGAWRRRFKNDDQGWQTREYQLLVARWGFCTASNVTQTFGEPPRNRRQPISAKMAKE